MSTPIKVPSVGESITEGTIARWLKKDGESVQADEPVLELETEKASNEIPAPADGVLHIKAPEGAKVAIGAVIGEIEADHKGAPQEKEPERQAAPPREKLAAEKPEAEKPEAEKPEAEKPAPEKAPSAAGRDGRAAPSPTAPSETKPPPREERPAPATAVAARLAPKEKASAKKQAAQVGETPERETRQRMSAVRQRIAERLVASQHATASLTTFNEADLSAVIDARQRFKDLFKEEHGVGLGFMSFFVKAAVAALKAHPLVNSRIEGEEIVTCNYWNIGVAVSTEKGLMVPVLHDADKKSFADIEKAIADLALRARDGKISVSDLQGGTFTITNGGIFGSMLSTPILNPPQSAILGMHAIQKRPVVREEQIVIRPMMYLALTYDHRLIDGREAVLFLVRVKECLENPLRLLLET
jgi:2-oxoglutarate dehydrogenase E2 component (dihydrolipoamide succinyltransferase)